MTAEFQEIGHSGGKITFTVMSSGHYNIEYRADRPVPMALTGIWVAWPQGLIVGTYNLSMGGRDAPDMNGCLPVLIASDSQGKFGHICPKCTVYWRSGPWPHFCPYCAHQDEPFSFLSEAQRRYAHLYCEKLAAALQSTIDTTVEIDMDAVADAVGSEVEKPEFYISEQSQQHKFTCTACGEFNDILGRFGYCSLCRTRNDIEEFRKDIKTIRDRLRSGVAPEQCVRDAVASFDSFVSQYAKQLAVLVPMIERRRTRLQGQRFHDLSGVIEDLKNWFGIDLDSGVTAPNVALAERMFHRRHVYEHNGGEVDQRYIDKSGDTSVKIKQMIRETPQDGHTLLTILLAMAQNLHNGFHEIVPAWRAPIEAFSRRMAKAPRPTPAEE